MADVNAAAPNASGFGFNLATLQDALKRSDLALAINSGLVAQNITIK